MNDTIKINWKKLRPDASIPELATPGAACFDLRAAIDKDITIAPGDVVAIPTGLAVEIPLGYEMQVRARSGLAFKHGFSLVNGVGTIDADYRGEIKILGTILARDPLTIKAGERIAQALIAPVLRVEHFEVAELSSTERAEGGFGSTGKN